MEQEIRKHLHNILAEVTLRKKPIWKKLGEIAVEMMIIVFAVSLAAFLERQREHNHEQREVKEFLTGLRVDLQNDIREMQEDRSNYVMQGKWFTYFSKETNPDKDTIKRYQWILWNTVGLLENSGRYEGFKSSGRMNTIENKELRTSILDLYQETLVALTNNTRGYINLKKEFQRLIYNLRRNEGEPSDNLGMLLRKPQIKNYCIRLHYTNEPIRRYDSAISKSERIIELINREYSNQ